MGLWRPTGFTVIDSDVAMAAQEVLSKLPERQKVQQVLHGASWLQGCLKFLWEKLLDVCRLLTSDNLIILFGLRVHACQYESTTFEHAI